MVFEVPAVAQKDVRQAGGEDQLFGGLVVAREDERGRVSALRMEV